MSSRGWLLGCVGLLGCSKPVTETPPSESPPGVTSAAPGALGARAAGADDRASSEVGSDEGGILPEAEPDAGVML